MRHRYVVGVAVASMLWSAAAIAQSNHTIVTLAGTGTSGFSGDNGPATLAELSNPQGAAVDSRGNVYIADLTNKRVRRIDALTGEISTFAGNGSFGAEGDGGLATDATVGNPTGVAVDFADNVYIAQSTSLNRVRRVDATTGIISTVAGNGTEGFSGDGGPAVAASLFAPFGVAVDAAGNIFIADTNNRRIRRVDVATGIISTIAGTGGFGFSGDGGPGTAALLTHTWAIAVDPAGNCYFADIENHRIRRVDAASGVITTVVGNGNFVFNGEGIPAVQAALNTPRGVAVDPAGNLLVSDTGNDRIRRVDRSTGLIVTIGGNGTEGFAGDNGPALNASLLAPSGLATDGVGSVYFADVGNQRVRRVENGPPHADAGPNQTVPAGTTVSLNGSASSDPNGDALQYAWTDSSQAVVGSSATVQLSLPPGRHTFTLTVTDSWGASASDSLDVVVEEASPPQVALSAPTNGGQVLAGVPFLIEWSAAGGGALARFDVFLSVDGGAFVPLAGCVNLPGTARSCTWSSPGPTTTQAVIGLVVQAGNGQTALDTVAFAVVKPFVRITSPHGRSRWRIGSRQEIRWNHDLGIGSSVRIEVSRDDGRSWTTIAAKAANTSATTGVFEWLVTGPRTSAARVRVTWLGPGVVRDTSDRFAILR